MVSSPKALVSAESISKIFHIYNRPIDRLKQAIWPQHRWYREFYALRDVSFELRQSEVLGIIGVNGSGKSTLLQIIAGTLTPTSGQLQINGRIGALLELGAGFNPEFTGIENIFLSGAIMGLSRREIRKFLPEIIDFAQIGDFIDQPVRIYSSGMFLRLAFSVCACLDPDVLIVDEALAVGDTAFVHKCMNRVRRLAARGIPILIVTHDTDSVRSLCNRVMWIDRGQIRMEGEPKEITSRYLQEIFSREKEEVDSARSSAASDGYQRWGRGGVRITNAQLLNADGNPIAVANWGDSISIKIEAQAQVDCNEDHLGFGVAIRNRNGLDVIAVTTFDEGMRLDHWPAGETREAIFEMPAIMASGSYSVSACIEERGGPVIDYLDYCESVIVYKIIAGKPIWGAVLPSVQCRVRIRSEAV